MKTTSLLVASLALGLIACASGPSGAPADSSAAAASACKAATEKDIAALFDTWNAALQTGDPHKVSALYAERSILLPTLSNKPRMNAAEKADHFHHFLANKPSGKVDFRSIEVGCNTAVDAGLYTFKFAVTGAEVKARYTYTYKWDGKKWLISSHHSSAMPEKI